MEDVLLERDRTVPKDELKSFNPVRANEILLVKNVFLQSIHLEILGLIYIQGGTTKLSS